MKIGWLLRTSALFFALTFSLQAQVPQIVNYQGRVLVGSTNFSGNGQFKFALVDPGGSTTFWSNDGTSVAGSEPSSAVSLSVANGLYSVLLGDTSIPNMTVAIPFSAFTSSDVRLRVWFNDSTHGSQLLAPDQRIAAVGYAMIAVSAVTVPATGVTGVLGVTHGGTGSTTPTGALTNLGAAATSGTLAQFAPTTSSQLAGVVSDETGTGSLVLANGPSLFNPFIGSGMFVSPFVFVESNDFVNNDTTDILTLRHTVMGTAANGIGAGIRIDLQNSSGFVPTAAEISGLFSNVTAGSEVSQLKFSTLSGGNVTTRLTLDNTAATFGARVVAPVGTAAAPGYSFTGDTNTGMFSSGADALNFATGGVARMTIDSAGIVSLGAMTVNDPTTNAANSITLNKTGAVSGANNASAVRINMTGNSTTTGTVTGMDLSFTGSVASGTARGINIQMPSASSSAINSNAVISTSGNIFTTGSGTITSAGLLTAGNGLKIGSTGDTISFFKNVTTVLDFPNTAAGSCNDLTVTVTGAQADDAVLVTRTSSFVCNGFFTARVSAADTVSVRFNNPNAVALDPTSATFRITVMR